MSSSNATAVILLLGDNAAVFAVQVHLSLSDVVLVGSATSATSLVTVAASGNFTATGVTFRDNSCSELQVLGGTEKGFTRTLALICFFLLGAISVASNAQAMLQRCTFVDLTMVPELLCGL